MAEGAARTLEGRAIVVTRAREQAGDLAAILEDRGARVLLAPAIRIEPAPPRALDDAMRSLASGGFAWVVLTSAAGVEAVFGHLAAAGLGPEAVRARVAAVGDGTARELRRRGIEPALVPPTFTTEALGAAMPPGGGRVLLARADVAPPGLEAALAAKGWSPVRVDAYRTLLADELPPGVRRALEGGQVDALTFTSASTVRGYLRVARQLQGGATGRGRPKVVCIGPVTASEARAGGLPVDAVAAPHTIEGLVAAVEQALHGPPGKESP